MKKAYIDFQLFKKALFILDLVTFATVGVAVYHFRLGVYPESVQTMVSIVVGAFFVTMIQYLLGGYVVNTRAYYRSFTLAPVGASIFSAVVFALVIFLFKLGVAGLLGRGVLLGTLTLFPVFAVCFRYLVMYFLRSQLKGQKWLLLISAEYVNEFVKDVLRGQQEDQYVVYCPQLGSDPIVKEALDQLKNQIVVKTSDTQRLPKEDWFGVIAGLSAKDQEGVSELLLKLRFAGHRPASFVSFSELKWQKVPIYFIGNSWFVFSEGFRLLHSVFFLRLKRLSDLLGAVLLLILAWPVMVLVGLAVKLESKGPGIYRQVRTGLNGKNFVIYKFRSMRIDAEAQGVQWAQKQDSRITRVGSFIRKTRLDELPQLWNVLKGDMSFLGPRPERPEFNEKLAKEIPHYEMRHLIRPGISGWAQVMYPYGASIEDSAEKLKYDLYYAKNYSIPLDIKIIFKTLRIVLGGHGR